MVRPGLLPEPFQRHDMVTLKVRRCSWLKPEQTALYLEQVAASRQ